MRSLVGACHHLADTERHAIPVAVLIELPVSAVTYGPREVIDPLRPEMELAILVNRRRILRIPDQDASLRVDRHAQVDVRERQRPLPLIPLNLTSHAGSDQPPVRVILVRDRLGRLPPREPLMGDAQTSRRCYFPVELLVTG